MEAKPVEEIDRIWRLRQDGSITQDEYEALKRRIIGEGAPIPQSLPESPVRSDRAENRQATPLFTILAGIFAFVCLFCPAILITVPVMITLGVGVVAMVKKERPRWVAPMACVAAFAIAFWASNQINSARDNLNNIGAEFNAATAQN